MKLSDNISLENMIFLPNAAAPDGMMLQAADTRMPSRAAFVVDAAGTFDIAIDYFDENDGVARMTLRVDGVDLGTWDWDADLGGRNANAATLTTRGFAGITLAAGSVVELVGQAQGAEPLRIGGLRFTQVAPPEPVLVSPYAEWIEAEAALTLENFQWRALDCASDGNVLQASDVTAISRASFAFDQTGTFDVSIGYFDESDGVSRMTLRVDGRDIGTWLWDAELGDRNASAATLAFKTFSGLALTSSSVIELVGQGNGGEPLRVDSLHFTPTVPAESAPAAPIPAAPTLAGPMPPGPPAPPAPAPATAVTGAIEAEAATATDNFVVRALDCASGGAVLQSGSVAAVSHATFGFDQTGAFDVTIDYFDENDGAAEMTLRVDGRDIGTWVWDADLGSRIATDATRTSKTFQNVALTAGSVIELIGQGEGGEPLRVDGLHFTPVYRGQAVSKAIAFAGAEGFGSDTTGGRGGEVVHVTSLADSGVGSLRWALTDVDGPRIVVFDVEGRIELSRQIVIDSPFVTLAGQTAPGEGIVVSGARISIATHDVIMRGMKLRVGDGDGDTPLARDNVSIGGGKGDVHHVVVDHNSFTWSVDENVAIWGTVRNVTISNNIIAEALNNSIHVDEIKPGNDPHSMGMIVGHKLGEADSQYITITKNLFESNMYRNAYIKGADMVEFTNNYVVNYGANHQALQLGSKDLGVSIAVMGNVYAAGADTRNAKLPAFDLRTLDDRSVVYLSDNFVQGFRELATQDEKAAAHGNLSTVAQAMGFKGSGAVLIESGGVAEHVLANAGARLFASGLDLVDQRIADAARHGTAKIIDKTADVGGYSLYTFSGAHVVDTDRDGMPDWFEMKYAKWGFDVHVADDRLDYDNDGFTNVEEYVNGLIDGFDFR